MTDTCKLAQKANRLIDDSVNGVVHSMFFHNHMHNVWVNNVLHFLTEFLRAHLNDSLDNVVPQLRDSPGFMSLACFIDKMSSIFANYPKGIGEVFRRWMMDDHSGEILLHVERQEYDVRQDVASMAVMEIYWNRNYCVEFSNEMINYYGKSEKILVHNLMLLILSVDIIDVPWLWSTLHISIFTLMFG